jgi:hypothetical protein
MPQIRAISRFAARRRFDQAREVMTWRCDDHDDEEEDDEGEHDDDDDGDDGDDDDGDDNDVTELLWCVHSWCNA